MELMSLQEQKEWLEFKKKCWDSFQIECGVSLLSKGLEQYEIYQTEAIKNSLHPIFLTEDGDFSPQRAARLICDYEIEILNDLVANPEAHLKWNQFTLELVTTLGILKRYDKEFNHYFPQLLAKGLIHPLSHELEELILRFAISTRGKSTCQAAHELSKKEIEEWDDLRGVPSLYKWSEVEN